jgi:hypothetical protein
MTSWVRTPDLSLSFPAPFSPGRKLLPVVGVAWRAGPAAGGVAWRAGLAAGGVAWRAGLAAGGVACCRGTAGRPRGDGEGGAGSTIPSRPVSADSAAGERNNASPLEQKYQCLL